MLSTAPQQERGAQASAGVGLEMMELDSRTLACLSHQNKAIAAGSDSFLLNHRICSLVCHR